MEDITLNTLKNAKKSIEQFLLSEGVVSDNYEASSEAAIILCEIHNCKKTDIVFNPDDMLSDEEKSQITDVLSKRKRESSAAVYIWPCTILRKRIQGNS